MLYMVIEAYRHGPGPVYARASERGRMLPPGLVYLESWVDERDLDCCFQLMETEEPSLFDQWIANWNDLVEFEIVPVVTSGDAADRVGADPVQATTRTMRFFTAEDRPDLMERYANEAEEFWPSHMEFVYHDPVCKRFWPRLTTEFPSFQFIVYDDAEDRFLAKGNTIPLCWSGRDEDLPDGVPAVLQQAFNQAEEGVSPTSLCALLAGVQPKAKATGLSGELLKHMKEIARAHGLSSLVAPVRPNLKERYPLTPMERYAEWRRADGLMFDPWLRTHERVGGRLAGIAPEGNVFRGTVSEWEQWTGLSFPESGEYVVPGALNPVVVDREGDEGVLTEPNLWMVHAVR